MADEVDEIAREYDRIVGKAVSALRSAAARLHKLSERVPNVNVGFTYPDGGLRYNEAAGLCVRADGMWLSWDTAPDVVQVQAAKHVDALVTAAIDNAKAQLAEVREAAK